MAVERRRGEEGAAAIAPDTPFGTRLRMLREAAGLTQEELAARAGLTANGISALERGSRTRPYPHTVRSLADALAASEEERAALTGAVRRRGHEPAHRETGRSNPTAVLPGVSTDMVGREDDLERIGQLLRSSQARLLTLTGPGGVGKTRLAVEVARTSDVGDGAVFVPLAPLIRAEAVLPAIARALDVRGAEGASPQQLLVDHLAPLHLLLVLDNFEHLLEAAPAVAEVAAACPRLRVLVSSRAPLRVRGETLYQVQPLALPATTRSPRPEEVTSSASGKLFLERARAVLPDFQITATSAADVAAICWRLAGLPLALELAAAKISFLDPHTLLSRLDDSLQTGWARDLPERQRTMRTTLDWSYQLLGAPEQRLFRQLCVFTGGFTLEAAESLDPVAATPGETLRSLETLVAQSLVVAMRGEGGGSRYAMLEPTRQYGHDLLREHGEEAATSRKRNTFLLDLAEQAAVEYQRADQVRWLDRVGREYDNVRAAIVWSLDNDEAETAARLGWALWLLWWLRGHWWDGRRWMESTLLHDLTAPWRCRTLLVVASMAYALGDYATSGERWASALDLASRSGDGVAEAYATAGVGLAAMATGDLPIAMDRFRRANELAERQGEDWLASLAATWVGTALLVSGDPAGAAPMFEAGLASARRRGDRLVTYIGLFNLSQAAILQQDYPRASQLLKEGVALSHQTGDQANLPYHLDAFAVVEEQRGQWQRSAVLLGAADGLRERVGAPVYHYYMPDKAIRDRAEADARAALGDAAFEDSFGQGRDMTYQEAVDCVMGTATDAPLQ